MVGGASGGADVVAEEMKYRSWGRGGGRGRGGYAGEVSSGGGDAVRDLGLYARSGRGLSGPLLNLDPTAGSVSGYRVAKFTEMNES
jgi:hypothetical protein